MSNSAFSQAFSSLDASTVTSLTGYIKGNGSNVSAQTTPLPRADIPSALAYEDEANSFSLAQTITVDDATNNNATTLLQLTHTTSGTAAAGLAGRITGSLENSAGSTVNAGFVDFYWGVATSGNTDGGIRLRGSRVGLIGSPGFDVRETTFGTAIGFYGATPVTSQNGADLTTAMVNLGLIGSATLDATALRYQLPLNTIDNPQFNIWQRGTSFATIADGTYTADRWIYNKSGAVVHTVDRQTDAPSFTSGSAPVSSYSLRCLVTTADASIAAGDFSTISHKIEGYNWASIAQQPFIISFWCKASQNGTIAVSVRNSGNDRSCVKEYLISGINSWNYVFMQFPASPSAGTWDYTTGVGATISFTMSCGSTYQTTAGSWQTGNFLGTSSTWNLTANVNDYLQVTNVVIQSYSASTATGSLNPMVQQIPYQQMLARCQRYYAKFTSYVIGLAIDVANMYNLGAFQLPVEMRVAPSLESGASFSVNAGSAGTVSLTNATTKTARIFNGSVNWTANANITVTMGLTADL